MRFLSTSLRAAFPVACGGSSPPRPAASHTLEGNQAILALVAQALGEHEADAARALQLRAEFLESQCGS